MQLIFCTETHEIKSSTGENDAIKNLGKHEVYEATACIKWHTVLQKTLLI